MLFGRFFRFSLFFQGVLFSLGALGGIVVSAFSLLDKTPAIIILSVFAIIFFIIVFLTSISILFSFFKGAYVPTKRVEKTLNIEVSNSVEEGEFKIKQEN